MRLCIYLEVKKERKEINSGNAQAIILCHVAKTVCQEDTYVEDSQIWLIKLFAWKSVPIGPRIRQKGWWISNAWTNMFRDNTAWILQLNFEKTFRLFCQYWQNPPYRYISLKLLRHREFFISERKEWIFL